MPMYFCFLLKIMVFFIFVWCSILIFNNFYSYSVEISLYEPVIRFWEYIQMKEIQSSKWLLFHCVHSVKSNEVYIKDDTFLNLIFITMNQYDDIIAHLSYHNYEIAQQLKCKLNKRFFFVRTMSCEEDISIKSKK